MLHTLNELHDKLIAQQNKWHNELQNMYSKDELISCAYAIAERQTMFEWFINYILCDLDEDENDEYIYDEDVYAARELLTDSILPNIPDNIDFNLIEEMVEAECNYNIAMWTTYDGILDILRFLATQIQDHSWTYYNQHLDIKYATT